MPLAVHGVNRRVVLEQRAAADDQLVAEVVDDVAVRQTQCGAADENIERRYAARNEPMPGDSARQLAPDAPC